MAYLSFRYPGYGAWPDSVDAKSANHMCTPVQLPNSKSRRHGRPCDEPTYWSRVQRRKKLTRLDYTLVDLVSSHTFMETCAAMSANWKTCGHPQRAGALAKVSLEFDAAATRTELRRGEKDEADSYCHMQVCKFWRSHSSYCCFMFPIVENRELLAIAHICTLIGDVSCLLRSRHLRRRIHLSIPNFHLPFISLEELGLHGDLARLSRNCRVACGAEAHEGQKSHFVSVLRIVIHQSTETSWPQADVVSFEKNLLLSQVKLKHCR